MESVECSECGARYDSQENPFCPRCGSNRQGATVAPATLASVARLDPRRRRVRIAGVVLMAMGGLFLANALASLFLVQDSLAAGMAPALADQPGGTLLVVADGAAPGANATLRALDDPDRVFQSAPLENGSARFELGDHAAVNVTVRSSGQEWSRIALVTAGDRLTLRFDLSSPAGHTAEPATGSTFQAILRVGLGALAALTALVVAGGVAAFRLRWRALALAGAVVGLLLGLLSAFTFLAVGLLFLLPLGYAFLVILRGRGQFTRPA